MLGFYVKAQNWHRFVRVKDVSITYISKAEPAEFGFCEADGSNFTTNWIYGTDPFPAVRIAQTTDALVTNATLVLTRANYSFASGCNETNLVYDAAHSDEASLVRCLGDSTIWRSTKPVSELWQTAEVDGGCKGANALEAGDVFSFSSSVAYESTLGLDCDGNPNTNTLSGVTVPGLGTVWLNELAPSEDWIELAAPAGRGITNWSVWVRNAVGIETKLADVPETVFADAVRGVGFLAVGTTGPWPGAPTAFLLRNASGHAESEVVLSSWNAENVYGVTGPVPYRSGTASDGSWSGTADELAGCWNELVAATEGNVNKGQSVDNPATYAFVFGVTSNVLPARVTLVTEMTGGWQTNRITVVKPTESGEEEPEDDLVWSDVLTVSGTNDAVNLVSDRVKAFVDAFGWAGDGVLTNLDNMVRVDQCRPASEKTNQVLFSMLPAVGYETFDMNPEDGCWIFERISSGNHGFSVLDGNGYLSVDMRRTSTGEEAAVLKTLGDFQQPDIDDIRRSLRFSVKSLNSTESPSTIDQAFLELSTVDDPAVVNVCFPFVPNVFSATSDKTWVTVGQTLCNFGTDTVPDRGKVEIHFIGGNWSGKHYGIDDVYLSFQDWCEVTSLTLDPAVPTPGKAQLDATYVVRPGLRGEGAEERLYATNVTVTLWVQLDEAEPVAVDTQTWPVLNEETNVCVRNLFGNLPGDGGSFVGILRCWTETEFDTNNGSKEPAFQRDRTFYPDNSSIKASGGNDFWTVTGEYAPAAVTWGLQRVWVNEINLASNAVEIAGRAGERIGGWSLEVRNLADGTIIGTFSVPSGRTLANVTNHCGFYVIRPSFQLPDVGGLTLRDAAGNTRYAYSYSYDAAVDLAALAGFAGYAPTAATTDPDASILAVEDPANGLPGNTANGSFGWDAGASSLGENLSGAINAVQALENAGPANLSIVECSPKSGGRIDVVVSASDLDAPISYSVVATNTATGDGATVVPATSAGSDGWSTATSWTATGLDQNQSYEIVVQARDALGTNAAESVSWEGWTRLDSFDVRPIKALSTSSVGFRVDLARMGSGQTAWRSSLTDSWSWLEEYKPGNDSWTPDSDHTVTFVARNHDGIVSPCTNVVVGTTLAAAAQFGLTAVTNDEGTALLLNVTNLADGLQCRNGNPDRTEYAVRIDFQFKDGQHENESTNWVNAWGTGNAWATWDVVSNAFAAAPTGRPWSVPADREYQLSATNIVFTVVSRNGAGEITETVAKWSASAHFDLTATNPTAEQRRDGSGFVDLSVVLRSPITNACRASLQWRRKPVEEEEPDWQPVTLANVRTLDTNALDKAVVDGVDWWTGISMSEGNTNVVSAVWDARAALGYEDATVQLRWLATDDTRDNPVPGAPLEVPLFFANPTVSVSPQGDKNLWNESPVFVVAFTEPVAITNQGWFVFAEGRALSFNSSGDTTTIVYPDDQERTLCTNWLVTVDPSDLTSGNLFVGISSIAAAAAIDDFGNASVAWPAPGGQGCTVTYDGKAPEVVFADVPRDPINLTTCAFTATASDDNGPITLKWRLGSAAEWTTEEAKDSPATWTVSDSTVLSEGEHSVSIMAVDAAGNGSDPIEHRWTIDTTAPSPSLSSTADGKRQAAGTNTFAVVVSFDKKVDYVDPSKVSVSGGSFSAPVSSDDGTNWTFTVTCSDNSAQEGAETSFSLLAGAFKDLAGNASKGGDKAISVTYDMVRPALVSQDGRQFDPPAGFNLDNETFTNEVLELTYTFTEPVSGLAAEDFETRGIFANGIEVRPQSGNAEFGTVWKVRFTIAKDGDNDVEVSIAFTGSVTDRAGNASVATTLREFEKTYSYIQPYVTKIETDIGPYFKANESPFMATLFFSQEMNVSHAFTASDFDCTNVGSVTHVAWAADGKSCTVSVTPSGEGEVSLRLKEGVCRRVSGEPNRQNDDPGNDTLVRVYDTTAPCVTKWTAKQGENTIGGDGRIKTPVFTVEIQFSEIVTNLAPEAFEFGGNGGSAQELRTAKGTPTSSNWVLTVACNTNATPAGEQTTVSLKDGAFADLAGNANAEDPNAVSVIYDPNPPTVSILRTYLVDLLNYESDEATFLITFSEPVNGFTPGRIATNSCAIREFARNDQTTWTVTVGPDPNLKGTDGSFSIQIPASTEITDDAGNDLKKGEKTDSVEYKGGRPEVVSIRARTADRYVSDPLVVDIEFSEDVFDFDSNDLDVGSAAATVSGGGNTWTVTVTPTEDGPINLTVLTTGRAHDEHGNAIKEEASLESPPVWDEEPPVILSLAGSPENDGTSYYKQYWIEATASDANATAGLTLHWVLDDGGERTNCIVAASGTAVDFRIDGAVELGMHTNRIWVVDASGRSSGTNDWIWTVREPEGFWCKIANANPGGATIVSTQAVFTVSFGADLTNATPFTADCLSWSGVTAEQAAALNIEVEGTTEGDGATNFTVTVTRLADDPSITALGLSVEEHVVENAEGIGNLAGETGDGKRVAWVKVDNVSPAVGPLSASPSRAKTGAPVEFSFDIEDSSFTRENSPNWGVESVEPGVSVLRTASPTDGVARVTFMAYAVAGQRFTISVRDAAGNPTIVARDLNACCIVDDEAPEITWSGVPSGEAVSSAQFAATITSVTDEPADKPDPDIRFRWAVVEGTAAPTEGWSSEAGAAEGVVVATNGLKAGTVYSFHVQAWDSAGNANATRVGCWTNATFSAGGTDEVSGSADGGAAEFTVSWPEDSGFDFGDGSYFLRTNNLTVTGVAVTPGVAGGKETNVTVKVTTADRHPGAFVELVVPAGALGGTNDAVQRVDFQVPVLTYVGRSLLEPNVLEWMLEGVDSVSGTNAFLVCDAKGAAPEEVIVGDYTKRTFVKAVVTNVLDNGATNWTIQVDDGAWDYAKKVEPRIDGPTNWLADVFVNWRLVYTNGMTSVTNAGPSEVNLALAAFGGAVSPNTQKGIAVDPRKMADGDGNNNGTFTPNTAIEEVTIDFRSFWSSQRDSTPYLNRFYPISFRSIQFKAGTFPEYSSFLLKQDSPGKDSKATSDNPRSRLETDPSIVRIPFSPFETKPEWINPALDATIHWKDQNKQQRKIYEFAMMGAPARLSCEKPTPVASLIDSVHSNGTLRVRVDSFAAFRTVETTNANPYVESEKISLVVNGEAPDHFSISNYTENSFEIVVNGVEEVEGDVTLTLDEGALWNTLYRSAPTNATFHVDYAPPQIASFDGSDDGSGNPVFQIALSENASGMEWMNFTASVTNATGGVAGEARIVSLVRDGTNATVNVHADRWESGATLTLAYAGTLVDAYGNTTTTNASASVELPAWPEATTARSLTIAAEPRIEIPPSDENVSTIRLPSRGTVVPAGTWWCGEDGTNVTVKVLPNAGWTFKAWTNDASTATPTQANDEWTISLDAGATSATATATFEAAEAPVTLTVKAGPGGRASLPETVTLPAGGSTNVTFYADTGYEIASVTNDTAAVTVDAGKTEFTLTLSNVDENTTVSATFKKPGEESGYPGENAGVKIEWWNVAERNDDRPGVDPDGGTNVVYNSNWEKAFPVPEGYTISNVLVRGGNLSRTDWIEYPCESVRTNFTVQLFGVVSNAEIQVVSNAVRYTIAYELGGGTNALSNPGFYTIEDKIPLADPGWQGHVFLGWTEDSGVSTNKPVTIEKGSTGDRTFTAVWGEMVDSPWRPATITKIKVIDEETVHLSFDQESERATNVRVIQAETLEDLLDGRNTATNEFEVVEGVPPVIVPVVSDRNSGFFRLEKQE